jgi:hypothetical protein
MLASRPVAGRERTGNALATLRMPGNLELMTDEPKRDLGPAGYSRDHSRHPPRSRHSRGGYTGRSPIALLASQMLGA